MSLKAGASEGERQEGNGARGGIGGRKVGGRGSGMVHNVGMAY